MGNKTKLIYAIIGYVVLFLVIISPIWMQVILKAFNLVIIIIYTHIVSMSYQYDTSITSEFDSFVAKLKRYL